MAILLKSPHTAQNQVPARDEPGFRLPPPPGRLTRRRPQWVGTDRDVQVPLGYRGGPI